MTNPLTYEEIVELAQLNGAVPFKRGKGDNRPWRMLEEGYAPEDVLSPGTYDGKDDFETVYEAAIAFCIEKSIPFDRSLLLKLRAEQPVYNVREGSMV